MSRYVDLDKLLEALSIFNDTKNGDKHFFYGIETAVEVAEGMVEKDLEKVVHCRDCVFKGEYKCRYNNMWVDGVRDYCSNARRASTNVQGNSDET